MVQMAESVLYTYDTAILQFADLTAEVSEKKSDYCHPIMSTFSLKYVAYRHSKWGLLVTHILQGFHRCVEQDA